MVQGDDATDTAAARLRQLHTYFREHPVRSAEGHSYTHFGNRSTVVNPGLPFNARVVEHIDRTVAEVTAYTRETNPDAAPLPDSVLDVYRWCVENTSHAPETVQQRRDILAYRHYLEHAIAAGDTRVIRPHRCPDCGTIGLHWQETRGKAICMNRHCARDNGGTHREYSLAQLAFEHVTARKNLRSVSAT
ncbi:hypothetical protein [Streptomyces griseosporeus]|uniref:hypothetical protein n=1 Tax=Streptomyces griseosporeus TaxID=1910 RepID=UPI0036F6ADFF